MKTEKTWIKIKLTELELENFSNHVNKNNSNETKFLNSLILNLSTDLNLRDLETGTKEKTFHIENKLIKILDKYSKIYNISRNKIVRYLINNLKIIDYQEKENFDTDISFYINKIDKKKIQKLLKDKNTNLSIVIRQMFDNIDLISLKDFDNDLNSKMKINVSSKFKRNFTLKAQELKMSNSQLVRSLINSLI